MKSSLIKKCNKIKLVMTDVDGVLTDGGMYYSQNGDVMKKFYSRDGMGVTLLRGIDIPTIIVTKEQTMMVKKWAKKMKIRKLLDGINNKEFVLKKICKEFKIKPENVAYIGDDVNDLKLMKTVGLSAAPANAIKDAKKISTYTCIANGGEGAFRELVDLILQNKKYNNKDHFLKR